MRRTSRWLCLTLGVLACAKADRAPPPVSAGSAIIVGGAVDGPVAQEDAAVAFDGTTYLLVWAQSSATSGYDVLGQRVSRSGQAIGSAFPISTAAGDQLHPAVASAGSGAFLVVWEDHRVSPDKEIFGARVTADGRVLDASGLDLSRRPGAQTEPDVAFDGASYLVVWEDRTLDTNLDVYGARVALDGVVSAPFSVSGAAGHENQPAVACGGSGCLVAWRSSTAGSPNVFGARVVDGAVLDAPGVAISSAGASQGAPDVATDGTDFLVAWNDTRNGDPDVYAARVGADGTLRDPAGIAVARTPDAQQAPAVAFEGAHWVAAWEDGRSGAWEAHGARIDAGGAVLDATGFVVDSGDAGVSLAVGSDGAGAVLVATDALASTDPLVAPVTSVRYRLVTLRAPLTVTKTGHGSGVVASSPGGVDCGGACSSMFDAPTEVALVATPDAGSVFTGWAGDCAGAAGCTVTVDRARSVEATFSALFPLTVAKAGEGAGTVTSTPSGVDCGDACSAEFVEGTSVSLVPAAPAGSLFRAWSGACAGAGPCSVSMSAAQSVTATFVAAYELTASPTGTGTGTITGNGLSCTSGCSTWVAAGDPVELSATPDAGSLFKGWSGACTGTGACTFAMTGTKAVSASFQPAFYALTGAFTGGGGGRITGGGLDCAPGATTGCSAQIANTTPYTVVTLAVQPDAGSIFKGWSGCTTVSGASCTVTVSAARTAVANVQPAQYPITLRTAAYSGVAGGTIAGDLACSDPAGCSALVDNGATLTLTAAPDASSLLRSWSGCTTANGPTCTVTMTSAKTVTATFMPSTYNLTVSSTGAYGATGSVSGPGVSCTTGSAGGCSAVVANGATVTLTATPDASSILKSWTGCTTASGSTCTVAMTSAKAVTASFAPSAYALTMRPASMSGGAGAISGAGVACSDPAGCTASVANGETVTLTATPDATSLLKSWSGCTIANGPTCTVTMASPKTVTATFMPSTYNLTVSSTGAYGATGTVSGPGLSCSTGSTDGCSAPIDNGATVTLTATPGASSLLKGWTGCLSVNGPTCTVTMASAKTVTASFAPTTYALTARPASMSGGAGTISGAGLACSDPAGCSASVANGDTVTLTATPDASSLLKSWTGCTTTSGATCTVTMTSPKTVTATFMPSAYALTVSAAGAYGAVGTVSGPGLSCTTGSTDGCSAAIENGATVTLTATPGASSLLKGWTGCTTVNGATCTVAMASARTVTASFVPTTYTLTARPASLYGGAGTISGAGLACSDPAGCTASVANGATVTLTATPDASSLLKSWTGCTSTSGATCTVAMTSPKTVTASFEPSAYPLTVRTVGTGTGTVSGPGIACATGSTAGCSADEPTGSVVTLTPIPGACSAFGSWSGSCYGTGTCAVTMSAARSVTATFTSTCTATAP